MGTHLAAAQRLVEARDLALLMVIPLDPIAWRRAHQAAAQQPERGLDRRALFRQAPDTATDQVVRRAVGATGPIRQPGCPRPGPSSPAPPRPVGPFPAGDRLVALHRRRRLLQALPGLYPHPPSPPPASGPGLTGVSASPAALAGGLTVWQPGQPLMVWGSAPAQPRGRLPKWQGQGRPGGSDLGVQG